MHLPLFAILITLMCDVIRMGAGVPQRRSAQKEMTEECRNCLECSHDNGCVRCPERLFLFLQRNGMSHHGTCLHVCPAGHYGQRGKDVNRCMKCRSLDCEHCFSRDFCTKCKAGFHLYMGKCVTRCPEGTFTHQTDCLEDCLQAAVGEWSDWSACLRNGVSCGFRWGKQTRTRGIGPSVTTPEEKSASFCPSDSETQRCRMRKTCPNSEMDGGSGGENDKFDAISFVVEDKYAMKQERIKKEDLGRRGTESDCDSRLSELLLLNQSSEEKRCMLVHQN